MSTKFLLPCKVTYSQVLGIRTQISLGGVILPITLTVMEDHTTENIAMGGI